MIPLLKRFRTCLGDRSAPFDVNEFDVEEMIEGIEEEESRVIKDERPEYDDWSFWTLCLTRDKRTNVIIQALSPLQQGDHKCCKTGHGLRTMKRRRV